MIGRVAVDFSKPLRGVDHRPACPAVQMASVPRCTVPSGGQSRHLACTCGRLHRLDQVVTIGFEPAVAKVTALLQLALRLLWWAHAAIVAPIERHGAASQRDAELAAPPVDGRGVSQHVRVLIGEHGTTRPLSGRDPAVARKVLRVHVPAYLVVGVCRARRCRARRRREPGGQAERRGCTKDARGTARRGTAVIPSCRGRCPAWRSDPCTRRRHPAQQPIVR